MNRPPLLMTNENGLYCAAGDFYIDPWRGVDRAVITHAHSDHARWGSRSYLCAEPGLPVLRSRLGPAAKIETLPYRQSITIRGVQVTFFPAGHILGSAQVRVEFQGEVWVVTGDYKREEDPTCATFEPVPCHTLITESTFGLPVYNWRQPESIFADINAWWAACAAEKRNCIILGYSLGKAQRILAGLDTSIGPVYAHGSVLALNEGYAAAGIHLPEAGIPPAKPEPGCMVIAPPSTLQSPWLQRFGEASTAFVSGWMAVRGARRRNPVDRGFALSDHADWKGLLQTVSDCQPEQVLVTHGFSPALVRYLNETGIQAAELATQYTGESMDVQEEAGA